MSYSLLRLLQVFCLLALVAFPGCQGFLLYSSIIDQKIDISSYFSYIIEIAKHKRRKHKMHTRQITLSDALNEQLELKIFSLKSVGKAGNVSAYIENILIRHFEVDGFIQPGEIPLRTEARGGNNPEGHRGDPSIPRRKKKSE